MAWQKVYQPKQGGLGICPLAKVNKVLLAKLAWRMVKNPTSLWYRILHAKYGSPIGKESVQNMSTCSVIWRGVWTSFQLLVVGLRLGTDGKIDREIWWERSAKGIFTTKSAYEIIS